MGKTPKPKNSRPPTKHSRAAKRATSPSIDVDKSIKSTTARNESSSKHDGFLAAHERGGVSKRRIKGKQVKRAQRLRHERGIAKAEQVVDQLVRKVDGAAGRERRRQERRIGWDDVNQRVSGKRRKKVREDSNLPDGSNPDGDESWTDDEVAEGVTQLGISTSKPLEQTTVAEVPGDMASTTELKDEEIT